jgi:hypothetical protein
VRVRLDVTDVQVGVLLRAAGARRFAFNWAVAKIKANADQWAAEATYGIDRADWVRPLTFFTLAKLWTHEKPTAAPWAGEHSTWTFRYALRDAATAHQAFLAGKRRFPRFKARHRDRARFTVRDGLALEAGRVRIAKYGWVRVAAACPAQAKLRRLARRGHATLQHITVTRHSDGHWYATVNYTRESRTPAEQQTAPTGPVVGVDRGVKTRRRRRHLGRPAHRDAAGVTGAAGPAPPRQPPAARGAPNPEGLGERVHLAARPSTQCRRGRGPGHRQPDGQPVPRRRGRRPGLGRTGPAADVQDGPPRWAVHRREPVVRELQDVLGVRCGETQAHPRRAHLPVR